ncbi:hypothetical protein LDENG_00097970 [Lucifuga dentata]|nr:hypothetical protein LDENG_00097970 [Lucifuga dentata]
MPRDNKTPLIQKIARRAHVTFTGLKADGEKSLHKHSELIGLVTAVRAADLKITPRKTKAGCGAAALQNPPVTYMHICETEVFSMGVFLLRSGASIPLHDHPGMNGMLKVLFGKVRVHCYDKLEDNVTASAVSPHFQPPLDPSQTGSLRRSLLRSASEFSESSGPCLLTPARDNLHQIDAVDGPAAFLDILSPPYDPDDGRDCHYYRVLQTVEQEAERQGGEEEEEEEKEKVVWLLEVPQPEDFWCGGEAYPGPAVSV